MLSVEDNRQLDANLEVWFDRLGSLVTDRSLAKVIEWLVRRYRIHEFNVQLLVGAFLPYHETTQFARVVQIVNLDKAPLMAFFLKPYQHQIQSGASNGGLGAAETRAFPLSSLISTLRGSTESTHAVQLLRWIAGLIHPSTTALTLDKSLASLPPHRALLSFWLSVLVHFSVLCSGQPKDSLTSLQSRGAKVNATLNPNDASTYLSVLLPAASALTGQAKRRLDKSSAKTVANGWQDALIGSSMLFSTVAGCFDLTTEAISASLDSLLEDPIPSKLGEQSTGSLLLSCYSLAANGPYDAQKKLLSVGHVRALLSLPGAVESMRATMAQSDISTFLTYFMNTIIKHWTELDGENHAAINALEDLLLASDLPEQSRQETVNTLVAFLIGGNDRLFSEQRVLVDVLSRLRQLYPSTFGQALEHQQSSPHQSKDAPSLLTALIAQSSFALHGSSSDDHLWLAAHSDQVSERVLALQELIHSSGDPEAVKDLLLSALVDKSPDVLEVAYQGGAGGVLLRLAQPEEVVSAITSVFTSQAFTDAEASTVSLHASYLLNAALPKLGSEDKLRNKIFTTVLFPYLISTPDTKELAQAVQTALTQAQPSQESFWSGLLRVCQDGQNDALKVSAGLAEFLAQNEKQAQAEAIFSFLFAQANKERTTRTAAGGLALLVLGQYLARNPLTNQSNWPRYEGIVQLCSELLLSLVVLEKAPTLSDAARNLQTQGANRQVVAELASGVFQAAVCAVPRGSEEMIGKRYFIGDRSYAAQLARVVYLHLVAGVLGPDDSKKSLLLLMESLGPALVTVFASVWTDSNVDSSSRALALQHVSALFMAYAAKGKKLDMQTLVPSLIIPLADKEESVRLAATQALQALANIYAIPDQAVAEIFAFDAVYGPDRSKQVLYLQADDAASLVIQLVGHAEALVAGPNNVVQFLGQTLSVTKKGDKKDGKKIVQFRHSVLENLLSHAIAWPSWNGTADLLSVLTATHSTHKVQRLATALANIVNSPTSTLSDAEREQQGRVLDLMFGSFDKLSAEKMSDMSDPWRLLKSALSNTSARVRQDACKAVVRIFPAVQPAMQLELVTKLATSGAQANDEHARQNVDALHALPVGDQALLSALYELRTSLEPGHEATETEPASKRSRHAEPGANDRAVQAGALTILLGVAYARNTALSVDLVAEYFDTMKVVNDLRSSGLFNTELVLKYAVQTLSNTASQGRKDALLWTHFRVDVLLSIIKLPLSVSLIHSVLHLLAQVAQVAPEQVVHNIMPIFTFVGSSFLSRDDRGSFSMVEMVIRDIVPALVADYKAQAPEGNEFALLLRCRDLLRIFTGAAKYMPKYRRVSFFKLLVRVLGADRFLGPVCMLFVDQQFKKAVKPGSSSALSSTLDLPLNVWTQFSEPTNQLAALSQTLDEVDRLLSVGHTDAVTASSHVFLDRLVESSDEHSTTTDDVPKQASALLAFVSLALHNLPPGTHHGLTPLATRALGYAPETVSTHAEQVVNATAERMPTDEFVSFISSILKSNFPLSVRLLQTRQVLEPLGKFADRFLPALVPATVPSSGTRDDLAPACLTILQTLGSDLPESALPAWTSAIPTILSTAQSTGAHPEVQSVLFNLLANLAAALGPRMIPFTVPIVLAVQTTLANEILALETEKACISLLGKLSHSLPSFMASHLATLVTLAVDLTVRHPGPPSLLVSTVINHFAAEDVVTVAATQVATLKGSQAARVAALLDLVRRLVGKKDRKTVTKIYKPVFRLLLDAFDTRQQVVSELQSASVGDTTTIEDAANATFLQVILKLNETLFRPLFLRFYDWAAIDLAEDESPVLDSRVRARLMTFFRFYNRMQETFKQLISSYDATVLDLKLEVFEAQRQGKIVDEALWTEVQDSMAKSAQYDEGAFWNATRAARVMPILVQALDLVSSMDVRVATKVAQSLTGIVRVVGEEGVQKSTNRELLDKARRATSTQVAVATLEVLQYVWTETGDDLLALVPETAPFLSELLGNPNPEVVEATQELVKVIEKVLGEPMDQYLT